MSAREILPIKGGRDHLRESVVKRRLLFHKRTSLTTLENGLCTVMTQKRPNHTLRLNVGFLLKESAGYSREIPFDQPGALLVDDVQVSNLGGVLCLTRTPQGVLVQGELTAEVSVECVRCLEPFNLHFSITFSDLFAYPASEQTTASYVVDDGGFLDLTPIVREESLLAIPMRALCRSDCKGLCTECGENLNERTCDCERDTIDPRLAPLRALLDE